MADNLPYRDGTGVPKVVLSREVAPDVHLPTVSATNFSRKFRDPFEVWPNSGWEVSQQAAGDIIRLEGNSAGSSYLVISLDPTVSGTETRVQTVESHPMPIELAAGISFSQRTLGQEFSFELVSTEVAPAPPADVNITAIQQATTTLSVTTATVHNLRVGMRIGIRDCADVRLNYPALVVATTPTDTTFTATAGPGGNIPSLTVGPFASGAVYSRSALAQSPNGTSMIFENASITNASFYAKSEGGDVFPIGGTLAGNHSTTVATAVSVQAVNAALNYAFRPTTEYRLLLLSDRLQWMDIPVDSVAQATSRANVGQIIPNPDREYKLRMRAVNRRSLTVPNAKIVSAVKTGTTTATVTTDVAHGYATGDLVQIYGARDQTNFPNVTTATAITVLTATTFTIVWGGAVTATTYSGFVTRPQGGQVIQGMVTNGNVQSVTRTNNVLTVPTNVAVTGLLIGDLINLHGVRDNTTGADLGVDGSYRVRDIQTTTVFLEPVGNAPTGGDIVLTNCGGAMIKRSDLRLSYVRIFDFERLRIEAFARPSGDLASALPVAIQGGAVTSLATVTTVTTVGALTGGGAAEDAAAGTSPVLVGGVVRTTNAPVTLVAGDTARLTMSEGAAAVVKPYAVAGAAWNASLALTTTTAAAIAAAAGASLKRHVTAVQAINTGAAVVDLIILDGVTERWRLPLPINVPVSFEFPTELLTTANAALNANLSAVGTVRANFQGYTSA